MAETSSTTRFNQDLVDFDYETWRKFGLKLYLMGPDLPGPMPFRFLTTERVHGTYQGVGLVKGETEEEVIQVNLATGQTKGMSYVLLMDLNSLLEDPPLRANSLWELIVATFLVIPKTAQMIWMAIRRKRKKK